MSPEAESDEAARQCILDERDCVDGGHPVHERLGEDGAVSDLNEQTESDRVGGW